MLAKAAAVGEKQDDSNETKKLLQVKPDNLVVV